MVARVEAVPKAPRGDRVGRGPRTDAMASKESWNAGDSTGTMVATAVKGARRWQRARETKICQVIQAERRVLNL
jgi:hypothetical protein